MLVSPCPNIANQSQVNSCLFLTRQSVFPEMVIHLIFTSVFHYGKGFRKMCHGRERVNELCADLVSGWPVTLSQLEGSAAGRQ